MDIVAIPLEIPAGCNVIAGQSHFIKTVEDIAEIVVTTVPGAAFGLAFCEAVSSRPAVSAPSRQFHRHHRCDPPGRSRTWIQGAQAAPRIRAGRGACRST